jgi:hypothetical protein
MFGRAAESHLSGGNRRTTRGARAWCACYRQHGLPPLPARPAGWRETARGQHGAAACRCNRLPAPPRQLPLPRHDGGGYRDLCRARQAGQEGRHAARVRRRPDGTARPGTAAAGLPGAFRRAELARIEVAHLGEAEHGLRITLPFSKGDRRARAYGSASRTVGENSARCVRQNAGATPPALPCGRCSAAFGRRRGQRTRLRIGTRSTW